jgi:hypothetical protein
VIPASRGLAGRVSIGKNPNALSILNPFRTELFKFFTFYPTEGRVPRFITKASNYIILILMQSIFHKNQRILNRTLSLKVLIILHFVLPAN